MICHVFDFPIGLGRAVLSAFMSITGGVFIKVTNTTTLPLKKQIQGECWLFANIMVNKKEYRELDFGLYTMIYLTNNTACQNQNPQHF